MRENNGLGKIRLFFKIRIMWIENVIKEMTKEKYRKLRKKRKLS
jgi:hypothetical protein